MAAVNGRKVVIVTGASRGIGLAITKHLLSQSVNVVVVARSRGPLDEIAKQSGGQVEVLAADLGDTSTGQKAVDAALARWSRLDGLVVNHGMLEPVARIADADLNEWKNAFNVNVFSAVSLAKAAIPALRKTKGRIVLCSSGAATKAYATWGCYGATKIALNHIAMTLAREEPDITTVAIRPGVVDTQMQSSMAELHHSKMEQEDAERFKKMKADGKMLRPEQPGNVMAELAVRGDKSLSGKFLSWDDAELKDFQSAAQ